MGNDKRILVLYSNIFIETYDLANFLSRNYDILINFTKERKTDFTGYNLSYNEAEVKHILKGTIEKVEELISRT